MNYTLSVFIFSLFSMKKHIVAPLVLLSSISLLTSCMEKSEPVPTVVTPTETAAPVEIITESVTPTTPAPTETVPAPEASVAPTVITRTEVVTYQSPAGLDPVEFSVTVTDGVITAASATPKSTNEISTKLQTAFGADVSAKAVGQKAKDLDLDVVGGASLTTAAFEQFAHSF